MPRCKGKFYSSASPLRKPCADAASQAEAADAIRRGAEAAWRRVGDGVSKRRERRERRERAKDGGHTSAANTSLGSQSSVPNKYIGRAGAPIPWWVGTKPRGERKLFFSETDGL